MKHIFIAAILVAGVFTPAYAHTENPDSLDFDNDLDEVVITHKLDSRRNLRNSAMQTEIMTGQELCRAACCNLGESFTTNPSVDVNYSDATTGARQIKLLGLPGTYVQMLTENIPNLRGAASNFGLGYIPGPWMKSIQVSKGASSVKNGYESVTGQINVEMLKPQDTPTIAVNGYGDNNLKGEVNVAGNLHLSDKLSSGILLHGENTFMTHDENDDGFADTPNLRQISVLNRWAWMGDKYVFQGSLEYLGERRESGQIGHHAEHIADPYLVNIRTNRGEAWMKHAYIFDRESNCNIALIAAGSIHEQKGDFGKKIYNVNQKNLYASLMFEREFGAHHSLSAGLSLNADWYRQNYRLVNDDKAALISLPDDETTTGGYVQYTYNLNSKIMVMGGIRYDYSSRYGSMVTPRLHARWNIADPVSFHVSAGRGYRTPHALSDNYYLLASGRELIMDSNLRQEDAWNLGGGFSGSFRLFGKKLDWGVEYYFTDFRNQMVVDLDRSPYAAYIMNLPGKSFSHAAQVELTYHPLSELTITAAYRYNDVRVDYGRGLVEKPLTARSKALVSINYAPMMGIWQFDATLAITGKGRMPDPDENNPLWDKTFKPFPTLNLQITRNFRHWAVYIGGENLTNYRQKHPIIGADNPWGSTFDSTMIYAPVHGAMGYIGFRYNL